MDLKRHLRITTALSGTMQHFVKALTREQREAIEQARVCQKKTVVSFAGDGFVETGDKS